MQELGLQRQRELGDLVEVDRSVVGVLELTESTSVGAGEGALLVTEQLGFEQAVRDRGAVDLDERRSEEHTSELQSPCNLVCRLLLEKKKIKTETSTCLNIYAVSRPAS